MIKSKGTLTQGSVRVRPGTVLAESSDGLATAKIDIRDISGNWIQKKTETTFFPKEWNESKVLKEVENAFNNRILNSEIHGRDKFRGYKSQAIFETRW